MINANQISAQYKANQVEGRSEFCPRKGFYRFISFHQGSCLGKPSLMAMARWKLNQNDEYSSQFFIEFQVESLRVALDKKEAFSDTSLLVGKEMRVKHAIYHSAVKVFVLTWDFLQPIYKDETEKSKLSDSERRFLNNSNSVERLPFENGHTSANRYTNITEELNKALNTNVSTLNLDSFQDFDIPDDYGDNFDYEGGY